MLRAAALFGLLASAIATCDSWCNPWTCEKSSCSSCSVCSELSAGTYCASYCNDYTCDSPLSMCAGCASCTAAALASRCQSWCSLYTCDVQNGNIRDCVGCAVCQDTSSWCEGWCNVHTCDNKYCVGCHSLCGTSAPVAPAPSTYKFSVTFQSSGSVTDTIYTDGSACTAIKKVVSDASNVPVANFGDCAITAASVNIKVEADVADAATGNAASSAFTTAISDASTMEGLLLSEGMIITVESAPVSEVIEIAPTPAPSWGSGRSRILQIFDKLKGDKQAAEAPTPKKIGA